MIFLVDIFMIAIGVVLALFAKDAYVWLKEWWRKRHVNVVEVAMERLRKKAKYENEVYGAHWHIPFSIDD